MAVVDLNADVGEWEQHDAGDAALMPFITSANIACGGHAGNAEVMAVTVALAAAHRVAIGAHPGFDDRSHFGRREIDLTGPQVRTLIHAQVGALVEAALRHGMRLRHVKPHGALYNMAARQRQLARTIAEAVAAIDRRLVLVGLSGSELIRAGEATGLETASEAFADRTYLGNGSLAPRSMPGAVLHDVDTVTGRAVAMVRDQTVTALDGTMVPLKVETICIHSDTPGAPTIARRVRAALEAAGIEVTARR